MMEIDEKALVEAAKYGDAEAFGVLVKRYMPKALSFVRQMTGSAEDAEDLAQEAFFKAYRGLGGFKGESSFYTWFFRVLSNICIDHLRRKKIRPPEHSLEKDELMTLRTVIGDPAQMYAADSRKRLINHALREMSDLNREIILLKDIQGLTMEEIASMLNVPVGTVKSRSNRARIELARRLAFLRSELAGDTVS